MAVADDLPEILASRINERQAVGILVATVDAGGRNVVAFGRVAKDRDTVPNVNTVFEIGSITKVFTSLLLADMVELGEVRLDTPVADL